MGNRNAANKGEECSWPKGLRIDKLIILLGGDKAVAQINGEWLKPDIPLNQLTRFLNEHVQGAVEDFYLCGGGGFEDGVLQLLDEVTVPGRLHTATLYFGDFFHLPWAGIERILDGQTLRANLISFARLQLPSGVDANELLKLPAVRESPRLSFTELRGPPPLFKNAALMEWLEQSDHRILVLSSDYLSSGPLSFLDALKENFKQATQVHPYDVTILCPITNGVTGGPGVEDKLLFNPLGGVMQIKVDADPTVVDERPYEKLIVTSTRLG